MLQETFSFETLERKERALYPFRMVHADVLQAIGNTPLVRLKKLEPEGGAQIYGKLEAANPSGSVKDRAALAMVLAAEKEGMLRPGATLIEPTSGNMGISLAMIAAVRGYRCILVMPDDMSVQRSSILREFGADVVLTRAQQRMSGAVAEADRILHETPGAFMPQQFENPANPAIHAETTAEEIWRDMDGRIDAFVAGVGTGGTLTGVARVLKQRVAAVQIVAVEPQSSAVLSGKEPGLHAIQGIGAGFVPAVLEVPLIDEVIAVSDLDAERIRSRLTRRGGVCAGPSSGANVHAAICVAERLSPEQRVVTVICDDGNRYLA